MPLLLVLNTLDLDALGLHSTGGAPWIADMKTGKRSNATEADLIKTIRIMNQLPPAQREVVFMRYYQNMSFKEIAEATGVSINTSLGRMRYAILNMRRMAREHNVMLQID